MKKTALTVAGIVGATILVAMGLGILLTGSFYFIPTITIDPFGDRVVDENGIMVVTGTTNLGINTFLLVNVSSSPGAGGVFRTELASVMFGSGGRNSWKAVINTSALPPGEYSVRVSTVTFSVDSRTAVPGHIFVEGRVVLDGGPADADRGMPEPFIIANEIGERAAGESIEVTGTTNLLPGIRLLWKVEPVYYPADGTNSTGTPVSVTAPIPAGSTTVAPGTAGINRWAFAFGSSGMQPGCYSVRISEDIPAGNFSGNKTEGAVEFVLSGTAPAATPVPSRFITIDTIPDQQVNARVVITGTTSLPAGEEFLVEISPMVGSGYEFVVNPKDRSQGALFAGITGNVVVVAGTGGTNLWSMDFDTYRLPPGEYRVNVSNSKVNRTTFRIESGDVSGTRTFIVRGGNS